MNRLEGIPLLGLFPNSPAERAGLAPGDLIVAVNGMRTQCIADFLSAKRQCKSAMQVVFVRSRVYYEATMHFANDALAPNEEVIAAGRAARLSELAFTPVAFTAAS
jgi:predicted metalloprotease with PDZ domain